MDKQSNRKKRRARGEGVTSYRVTSSLSLTDQAYEHQQRLKQQRANQGPAPADYPQDGYYAPQTYAQPSDASPHSNPAHPQQAHADPNQPGYYDQQAYADPNQQGYYDQQAYADPNQQGYYDQQAHADPNQQGYYDQQAYADPNQQGYYDQQAYADPNQPGYYDQQAYADPNQQGYYDQQAYADPNQQGYYDQGYADPNQQGYYDQQAYADPNQQGYYDQQAYADPNQPGYYDQQAYADPNQQGYYDQGYADPNQQGYYGQGYADPNQQGYYGQGYADPNQQGYYDGQGPESPEAGAPRRKRKIESVKDYFNDMLGEGYVFATDANDSPHQYESAANPVPQAYTPQYPPPHLVPQNPLAQALGPVFSIYLKLREKWAFLVEKFNHYTDMLLDVQESVQKELKEAFNLAFKGFMDQLKQKSPLGMPYQQPLPAYAQQGGQAYDPAMGPYPPQQGPAQPPVSFVDLYELNVSFTDNYDEPLFDFSKYANSQYQVSKMVADPVASEAALWAIQECAQRAGAIPPAQEGPYANLPLTEVMGQATMDDLQAFLRYVKAFPGNYVSRNLKVSETFATWVVYGAPAP